MGNFCTYDKVNISGVSGIAPLFKIYTNNKGEFLKGEIISTYQEKHCPPRVDAEKKVLKVISKLTKEDFPEMTDIINIDDNGIIKYK
jgi:hypothetical protein